MGMMINRRRVCGGEKLPQGAVRIEYLESTGTQWIDTGISATDGIIGTEIQLAATAAATNNWSYGTYNGNDYYDYLIGQYSGWCVGLFNSFYRPGIAADTNVHTVKINIDGKTTFDSVTLLSQNVSQTGGTNTNIFLFGTHKSHLPGYTLPCKIYYCKIYKNSELVRDFIPVLSNEVGYMYDKVSGELFGNQGTGSFLVPPNANIMHRVEYIESDGKQYITTGIQPSVGDVLSYDVTVQYPSNVVSDTWLTGWYVAPSNSSLFGTYQNRLHFTYNTDGNKVNTATGLYDKNRIRYNMDGGIYVNDTLISSTVANNTPLSVVSNMSSGLVIFAKGDYSEGIKAKLFAFKIYLNQTLVFDGVPVRVFSEGYIYDNVSGQLFYNKGIGAFILGPDK